MQIEKPYSYISNITVNGSVINIELPGTPKEDISISTEGNTLKVSYKFRGYTYNDSWQLAKIIEVGSAEYKDGLLKINLVSNEPKPVAKKIDIRT
jgi:HSP20 family molecular chaperone IbpA